MGVLNQSVVWLRCTPWLHVLGIGYLVFLFGAFIKLAAPAEAKALIKWVGLVTPLLLLSAKELAHTPEFLQRMRRAAGPGIGWTERLALVPAPELLALLKLERSMWHAFFDWIRRRVPVARPRGAALTYLERGAYSTAISIALVAVLIELPINMLIVAVFVKDPSTQALVHILGAALGGYSLIWVLGDRWYVQGGYHVLTDTVLDMKVGSRTLGQIPLCEIERYEQVTLPRQQWCRRNGVRLRDTVLVSPIDRPNLVLVLKPETQVEVLHYQLNRLLPRYVFLYVDRPELLRARLARQA